MKPIKGIGDFYVYAMPPSPPAKQCRKRLEGGDQDRQCDALMQLPSLHRQRKYEAPNENHAH